MASVELVAYDFNDAELDQTTIWPDDQTDSGTGAVWYEAHAGASHGRVRLRLDSPNATLKLREVAIATEP